MGKRVLRAASIDSIKPPKKGQEEHFDKGYPGLALRLSYGGRRSFVYFYRSHGKLRRMTLGTYPAISLGEAREAWRTARATVERGGDPAQEKRAAKDAPADTVKTVAEEWLKRDQAKRRGKAEVERILNKDVYPALGDRRIESITRRDIVELIDTVADRGAATMARRTHAHLHRMFRWCVGCGIIEANPMTDLPKPGKETSRDRVLNDDEITALWKASDEVGRPFGNIAKLLLLTGARRTEIGALKWSEFDLDTEGVECIRLEGGRTKTGEPHRIPLTPAALAVVRELPKMGKSEFVFTTTGETPVSGWGRAKTSLTREIEKAMEGVMLDWRLHDIRRTVATNLQRLGIRLEVTEAVLGHVSGSRAGIVGVYQRYGFEDEKRAALTLWARRLETIIGGGAPANVVELRAEAQA